MTTTTRTLLLRTALVLLTIVVWCCTATDITWHANVEDADTTDPARTAPKSQKYWDEHNIVKPDYAYTDAEYRAMKKNVGNVSVVASSSNGIAWTVATCFVLGMATGLYVLYVTRGAAATRNSFGGAGTVLGSGQQPATTTSSIPVVDAFVRWLGSAMNTTSLSSPHRPPSTSTAAGADPAAAHDAARQARLARFQQPSPAASEKAD